MLISLDADFVLFHLLFTYPESVVDFVDDGSVGCEVLVAGLYLGVLLEVALGSQVVRDLDGHV